jgi:hypothetical protein
MSCMLKRTKLSVIAVGIFPFSNDSNSSNHIECKCEVFSCYNLYIPHIVCQVWPGTNVRMPYGNILHSVQIKSSQLLGDREGTSYENIFTDCIYLPGQIFEIKTIKAFEPF